MDSLSGKDGKTSTTKVTGKTLRAATVVFCLLTQWETPASTEKHPCGTALKVRDFSWKQLKHNSRQVIKCLLRPSP